jgi:hypothetical protein
MAVVAGTPFIDWPKAWVVMTLLPWVTRTMTDRSWYVAMAWRTMVAMEDAWADAWADPAAAEAVDAPSGRPDAPSAITTVVASAITRPRAHRAQGVRSRPDMVASPASVAASGGPTRSLSNSD